MILIEYVNLCDFIGKIKGVF